MLPGQKSVGANGKENILFPLETLRVTQDSFGTFSHLGSWAVDTNRLAGVKDNMYAPYSGTIVVVGSPTYAQFAIISSDLVNHADGTVSKAAMLLVHSENMPANGTVFKQGDLMCQTGSGGQSSGVHLHFEVNKTGAYTLFQNAQGTYCLTGQHDPANSIFMNDTDLLNPGAHDWKIASGTTPTPQAEDDISSYLVLGGFYNGKIL